MERVSLPGMMDLHIKVNINMEENMESELLYLSLKNTIKASGFTENKTVKEYFSIKLDKSPTKAYGKTASLSKKLSDDVYRY